MGFVTGIESDRKKIINHDFVLIQGRKSTLESKIGNVHDSASLVMDCKSLTLGWISLSLYIVVLDSYSLSVRPTVCLSTHLSVTICICWHHSYSFNTILCPENLLLSQNLKTIGCIILGLNMDACQIYY